MATQHDVITECQTDQFRPYLGEVISFLDAAKRNEPITDGPRLVALLRKYFQLLLYCERHSPRRCLVTMDGRAYHVKLNGHDEHGNPCEVDVRDAARQLLLDVISHLSRVISLPTFTDFTHLTNSLFAAPNFPIRHKTSLLNAENSFSVTDWYTFTRQLPEELAVETVEIRRRLVVSLLKDPDASLLDPQYRANNLSALHTAYERLVKTLVRIHIANGHFDEVIPAIRGELDAVASLADHPHADSRHLVAFLLAQLVLNNNLFHILRRDHLREYVDTYTHLIEPNDADRIKEWLQFTPDDFELSKFQIARVEPEIAVVPSDQICTAISFVVPYALDGGARAIEVADGPTIVFRPVRSLLDDPIYTFLDSTDGHIHGMPMAFMADSLGHIGRSTAITVVYSDFYHPDFDIVDSKIAPRDNSAEEARRGGLYHPHKDRLLQTLWQAHDEEQLPFDVERRAIDSSFISNFLVSYVRNGTELLHHRVFTITNFRSYYQLRKKFAEELNRPYMGDDAPAVRDFILDTKIVSPASLLEFCYRLIELSVKKSLEVGGLETSLWRPNDQPNVLAPVAERGAQPILYNQIRYLADVKGIMLSREVVAAGGALDFHFSYTKNDRLMNVCVELKNAHNPQLEHGITTQLPLYMSDVGGTQGIFLVLWYKCAHFQEPTQFSTPQELEMFLQQRVPGGRNIKPMVIDCSKKPAPSTPGAKHRLSES